MLFDPLVGARTPTLRTCAIVARVVLDVTRTTGLTFGNVSAKRGCSTTSDVPERASMAGQHGLTKACQVAGPVSTHHVDQAWPCHRVTSRPSIDRGLPGGARFRGESRACRPLSSANSCARGSLGCPERNAVLNQVCRIAVSERVNGSSTRYLRLFLSGIERLLNGRLVDRTAFGRSEQQQRL